MSELLAGARAGLAGQRRWLLAALALVVVVAVGLRFTVFASNRTSPPPVLLFSATGNQVEGIAASDGSIKWHVSGPYTSVFAGAKRVLAAQPMQLTLLDAATGQVRWHYALHINLHVDFTQAIFTADTVYIALATGGATQPGATLLALSLADGHLRWQYSVSQIRAFQLMRANDLLLVGERATGINPIHALTLAALDTGTGAVRWHYTHLAEYMNPVSVQGTTLLVHDGAIAVLDLATGAERWHTAGSAFGTAACVENDVVYASAYPATATSDPAAHVALSAYRLTDGTQLWQRDLLPEYVIGVPGCTGATLIVEQFNPHDSQMVLYGIDARTGAVRWHHAPQVNDFVDAGLGNGQVIAFTFSTSDELLAVAMLNPATGTTRWQTPLGVTTMGMMAPLTYQGTIYVTLGTTQTYALDAATGKIRWQRPVFALVAPDGTTNL